MNKASLKAKGIEPISEYELERRHLEMLNEAFEPVNICGHEYAAGDALARIDRVAFDCSYADWISAENGETLLEIDGEYYDIWEVTDSLNNEEDANNA